MANKQQIILHIDMNSYFASVEQQANPFLRGKSVGVCSYLSPNGVVIASSMEAKKKGIKTGCKVWEAKIFDPNVVFLENEPAKYRSTTERIFKIFGDYTDTVEPYSIDEAFLDLSGWVSNFCEAEEKAREMQKRIKCEVGDWLNSSVGISWTKFLAKFAGDIAPKKSILIIGDEARLNSLLYNRPLTDAWGINLRTEARLQALGIRNLLELKRFSGNEIRRFLGRWGYYLWANVNGEEITAVSRGARPPKSIGHSYCVPKKTTDKKYLGSVLYKLCEKTGRRLRSSELEAQNISIYFAYANGVSPVRTPGQRSVEDGVSPVGTPAQTGGGIGRSFKTPEKMFTTEEIYYHAGGFLRNASLAMPVRMVAVSVGRLAPVSGQMSLFEDNLSRKDLSRAVDRLNDKYGEFTVVRGRMFGTEGAARDRIGFRKVN